MKYLHKITLGLLVCLASLASCSDDDKPSGPVLNIDREEITVGAEGGKDFVQVTSTGEWAATVTALERNEAGEWVKSNAAPWASLSPANGSGFAECAISIDSTLVNGMRKAEIRFRSKGLPDKVLTINQTGYGKMAVVEKPNVELKASAGLDERYFDVTLTANVPVTPVIEFDPVNDGEGNTVQPDAWVFLSKDGGAADLESYDRGARPRTFKLRFTWNMNAIAAQRVARVKFEPKNADDQLIEPSVLTITQEASPKITDDRAGDSLALLIIKEKLESSSTWDPSENMRNWSGVRLWEVTDEGVTDEMVGRVREVAFNPIIKTKESLPQEVRYLKYVEKLVVFGNTNTMNLNIKLGSEVCELEHLKYLQVSGYGLISLPDDFARLGKTLESLDLNSNNFTEIPDVLTPENFPKLRILKMHSNRRWTSSDLRNAGNTSKYPDGLGMHFKMDDAKGQRLKQIFLWQHEVNGKMVSLDSLVLSVNYLEGQLPTFEEGETEVYTQADVDAFGGDTIQYLADHKIPKLMMQTKGFAINLNFFTGKIPDWLLYHPHLLDWNPEIFIFNQETGVDSNGDKAGFSNTPTNYEYYYKAFPKFREKYELEEETTE